MPEIAGDSFENVSPFVPRRLHARKTEKRLPIERQREILLEDIDGPAWLDGEEVPYNQFTVTLVRPIDYEITEEFLAKLLARNAFHGLQDGRERELGPIRIVGLELRPPPVVQLPPRYSMRSTFPAPPVLGAWAKAARVSALQQEFSLPARPQAAEAGTDRRALLLLPTLLGAAVPALALLGAVVAALAARRRQGYERMRLQATQEFLCCE